MIAIYNQGNICGDSFVINDYVPSHLSLSPVLNPGWSGSGVAYTSNYVLSDTICTGDSVAIPVKLIVLAGGLNIQSYTNHAEINSVKGIVEPNNPYGAVQIGDLDIDSNPDSNPTNDNGADASNAVNNPADNVITGTGGVP
ncbi:MAG: hypothetical protein IPO25_00275 [Saprospiraceae bacterium]|nr:hypothetical protein [Saprospiraceae bacterium]